MALPVIVPPMRTRCFPHPVALLLALVAVLPAFGCSMFSDSESPAESAEGVERADAQIFVGDTIEMNYDPNVIMKRAESFHEKEGYPEAIIEYEHFLELHRNHVLAPYAQYRLALSHFKMADTIDRDVTPVRMAREAFVTLLTEFPGSHYEAEALATIRQCDAHLARQQLFIGKFYYHKEAYMAAAKRFRNIIDAYPNLDEAVESKLYLTKTYAAMGAMEWARDWAMDLVREHPRHALRQEGMQILAALHKEHPELAATDHESRNALVTSLVPTDAPTFRPPAPRTPAAPTSSLHSAFRASGADPDCRVGTWCDDAMGVSPYHDATAQPAADQSVTCRSGAWCE